MATSIDQYTPVFLPGEPLSLTEKPGRPQSTGSQRVEHDQSNSVCIDTRFFSCGSSASVRIEREHGAAAWLVGTLWHQMCRDTDCLCYRSYGTIRVFFQASCSWRSEGLFGKSFSKAPLFRHLEGFLAWGLSLLFSMSGT